jgi:hypothetical protein
MEKYQSLARTIYTYIVCAITIVAFLIGAINALNISIKYFVFDIKIPQYESPAASLCESGHQYTGKATNEMGELIEPVTDEEREACIKRVTDEQLFRGKTEALSNLSWSLAAMLISFPLWFYHWRFVRK